MKKIINSLKVNIKIPTPADFPSIIKASREKTFFCNTIETNRLNIYRNKEEDQKYAKETSLFECNSNKIYILLT